jgi:uncharacterized membrane protein YphA (DoxX/SURF4 family)
MKKIIDNPILVLVARLVISGFFIFYGISKIAEPASFANEIGNYNLMPEFVIQLMALVLPWLEVTVGLLILFGIKLKENGIIAASLLIVFTLAVAIAFASGLDISCGCSSSGGGQKVGWAKIAENTGLIILSLLLSFTNSDKFRLK